MCSAFLAFKLMAFLMDPLKTATEIKEQRPTRIAKLPMTSPPRSSFLMPENVLPSVHDLNGKVHSTIFLVMSTKCIHCGQPVTDEDGAFYAAFKPYQGLLHRKCAPFYAFSGEWPHEHAVTFYLERGKIGPT